MKNNNHTSITTQIFTLASQLPYFRLKNLARFENNTTYLKVLLSRYNKAGKIIRLKKGVYTSDKYLTNLKVAGGFGAYPEFIANVLSEPSYLSLEYVLHEHGILTDIPTNFTSVTLNKPISFTNNLGTYTYHHIKSCLYTGFETIKTGDFIIRKASKAKALFDFLYYRKNIITNQDSFLELRLNLENISINETRELKRYCKAEETKMLKIFSYFEKVK